MSPAGSRIDSGMNSETSEVSDTRRYTVFFDGMCPVCNRSRRALQRIDWLGRLEFSDLHDRARAEADLPSVTYADMLRRMYVRRPDGRFFGGFHAFRAIARVLPVLWLLLPILWLPGASWIGTRVYDWIARNRFRRAQCDSEVCSLHLKLLSGRVIDDDVIRQVIELHARHRASGASPR